MFLLSIFLSANGISSIFGSFEVSYHVTFSRSFFRQYLLSLGVSVKYENFSTKNKKLCKIKRDKNEECEKIYKPISCYDNRCWVAPEDYFEWENLPSSSDAFLLPIMSKKYLKEIGYYN